MKQDSKGTWKKMADAIVTGTAGALFTALIFAIMALMAEGMGVFHRAFQQPWFGPVCAMVEAYFVLCMLGVNRMEYRNRTYRPGRREGFCFVLVGAGSVIFDANGTVVEVTDDDQWFWPWEWKISPYSLAQIVCPPEEKKSFVARHVEIIGIVTYFHWGYSFSVKAPQDNLEELNRLKQAVGDGFVKSQFSSWCRVVCSLLAELDRDVLLDLDTWADSEGSAKQERFKTTMRGLLIPRFEAMGLEFIEDSLTFRGDGDGCSGCH